MLSMHPTPSPRSILAAALLVVLTGSVLLPAPAEALTLRLEQHWRDPLFDSNGQSVRTVAYFEDDSITGVGTKDVLVDLMGVTGFLFGVGQNFNFAQFTMPPNFTTDYNIYVRYVGGAFSSIHNVNTGGASLTPLGPTINPPSDSGLRISMGGGQIAYGLALSLNILTLYSTEITVVSVPEPTTALLLACGLLGLAAHHRRRRIA